MKTTLLDLPDEVLLKIFHYMHGPRHSRRYARQARHANALSLTCPRLRSIYASTLQVLDARDYGNSLFFTPLPRSLNVERVFPFLSMAGGHLQVCRLPTLRGLDVSFLLQAIAEYCPNVTELAFTDKAAVEPHVADMLFSSCKFLTHIEVLAPSPALLESMARVDNLKDLSLTCVPPENFPSLVHCVVSNGKYLKRLHIGITESTMKFHATTLPGYNQIDALLCFASLQLPDEAPALEELRIDASPATIVDQVYCTFSNSKLHQLIADVQSKVSRVFINDTEDALDQNIPSALKHLKIKAADGHVFDALDALARFIPLLQTLSVNVPGAEMMFTKDQMSGRGMLPTLRSLRVLGTGRYPRLAVAEAQLFALEILDIHCVATVYEPFHREFLLSLASHAGENLKSLRATEIGKLNTNSSFEDNVSIILGAAPRITTLDLSFEIVFHAHDGDEWLVRLVSKMKYIQRLNLKSHLTTNRIERSWMPMALKFVKGLPILLKMLASWCPSLEILHMETLNVFAGSGRNNIPPDVMREALTALIDFEYALPKVDAGTIRAQLFCLQTAVSRSNQNCQE